MAGHDTDIERAPSVATAPMLQTGGTLSPDALYIRRKEDDLVYSLLRGHEYCNILTTRQMGKSSLMSRLRARLGTEGVRTVSIDLAGDIGTPRTADEFYRGVLDHVVLGLRLDLDVTEWWEAATGQTPNQRLVAFFRDEALSAPGVPVVIFLDEIDATLKLPFSDDLFTAIRTLFNGRPEHPVTRRLTFCLLGTATPSELIKDRRTTPYNIGHTIELVDFDPARDDLSSLEQTLARSGRDGAGTLADVLGWTGGHPFLTMTLCRRVLESPVATSSDAVVRAAIGASVAEELRVHFAWINRFMAERLQHGGATFQIYTDLLARRRIPPQTDAYSELRLSGLAKIGADGYLVVRNRIYRERFGRDWLRRARPPRVALWARRALVALAALVVLSTGVVIVQHRRANAARDDVLRQIEMRVASLPQARNDAAADLALDQATGLIASVPSADQNELLARIKTAYDSYWERQAQPYRIASDTERSNDNFDKALILAAAAAAKLPTIATHSAELLAGSALHSHLLATLHLTELPIHVRRVSDSMVAVIGTGGLFGVWAIDNHAAPSLVPLETPIALASAGNLIAVAGGNSAELWQVADPANASADTPLLQRTAALPGPCSVASPETPGGNVVKTVALGTYAKGTPQLAIGCADGRVLVDWIGADPKKMVLFSHASSAASSTSMFALAFGPRPDELVSGTLPLWATVWTIRKFPPAATRLEPGLRAQAYDVRVANSAQRIVVSGLPLDKETKTVVYRQNGAGWVSEASFEQHRIVASDITPDGSVIATAVQTDGGGDIVVWDPHKAIPDRELLRITTVKAEPRDLAWLAPAVLVVAMSDKTLRVLSVDGVPPPTKDSYRQWQARLGLTVDDGSNIVPRPLWGTGDTPSGYAAIRGPKQ